MDISTGGVVGVVGETSKDAAGFLLVSAARAGFVVAPNVTGEEAEVAAVVPVEVAGGLWEDGVVEAKKDGKGVNSSCGEGSFTWTTRPLFGPILPLYIVPPDVPSPDPSPPVPPRSSATAGGIPSGMVGSDANSDMIKPSLFLPSLSPSSLLTVPFP